MTTPLIPHTELVAKAWLVAAVGLTDKVATTLPDDTDWPDNEFVQITDVGGGVDIDVPRLNPVIGLMCYANKPGSLKPPWGQANQLAMKIWQAAFQIRYANDGAVKVALPSGYGQALVTSVWPVSSIRRAPSDPSQYAVFTFDLAMSWVPSGLVIA